MIGRTLSHYKILETLGSGGMGDVYLAEDTRLDRKVALKVLPPETVSEKRLERFKREAKAIAALDHPNIVQVFSVEESEGVHFITMQLVPGKTLTELLPKNGFPLCKFLEIAIPLADAVAAAHEHGIVHRDLKPSNVMVADDGRVKVLDFGLAKATAGFMRPNVGSEVPTAAKTDEGVIVGTVSYMSPEQAEAKSVDHRTDIFALGIILYEMATGQRPFHGDSAASIVSSILKDNPVALTELVPTLPSELSKIVRRCLVKDAEHRYQSAKDVRNELEELKQDIDSGEVLEGLASRQRSQGKPWLIAASLFITVLALTATLAYLSRQTSETVIRLTNPVQVTSAIGVEAYPTWSPDGVRLAYEASKTGYYFVPDLDIWVAQLGSGEPVNLAEGLRSIDRLPSWSPDGRQIAFLSDRDGVWGVHTLAAIGGSSRNVLSLPGFRGRNWSAPQWSRDGSKLLVSVNQAGENVVIVLSLQSLETSRIVLPQHEGNVCWDVSISPDGGRFAYVEGGSGATEVTRLWTIPASGGEAVALTDGLTNVWSPTWSRDGEKLFYVSNRGGSMDLWQQALAKDGTPIGEPLPVTQGLGIRSAVFSPDGRKLAYTKGRWVRNVFRVPLLSDRPATWDDVAEVTSEHAHIEFVDVSPDGQFLAVSSDRSGNQDLWLLPAEGGEMTQLTSDPTPDWHPRWSPDGSEIVFYSYRSGNRDIWVMPSRGGPARQLTLHPAQDMMPSWSPDGKEIAFHSRRAGDPSIWIVGTKEGEPRHLTTEYGGGSAEWSPDGHWLVFERENRLYRIAREGGEPVLLLDEPAYAPRFSPDGQSIFHTVLTGPRDLWSVSLETGDVSRLTQLEGRRGSLGYSFATGGDYLYFTWSEDLGDIWVMDVVTDEDS